MTRRIILLASTAIILVTAVGVIYYSGTWHGEPGPEDERNALSLNMTSLAFGHD